MHIFKYLLIFLVPIALFQNGYAQTRTLKKSSLPLDWHHLSFDRDSVVGVETGKAYDFLASTNRKAQKITVAVIDADLDTRHEDLKEVVWVNPGEEPDQADNDKNGYIDDIHGWNFLGIKGGGTLTKVGTEPFREYKRLRPRYEHIKPDEVKEKEKQEYAYFLSMRKQAKINSYLQFGEYLRRLAAAYAAVDSLMGVQFSHEATLFDFQHLQVRDTSLSRSYEIVGAMVWRYDSTTLWSDIYQKQQADFQLANRRIESLDDSTDPREVLKENKKSMKGRDYGNNTLAVTDSDHGTFVAALVGASRGNGRGMDGVADQVEIMGVVAVPDGDEYDKDVAMAIRYAVDNGARIINMSFGKYVSPDSRWVEKAVAYATRKGVLMVHAAGNDSRFIDTTGYFPTGFTRKQLRSNTFIRVGASTPSGDAASLSNYGRKSVDLFAPGVNIYSALGNNSYGRANGTSAAAPIVTGVAALVWSYYPELTTEELHHVLLASVTPRAGVKTPLPGSRTKELAAFEELCASGGIVNAYQAVKLADALVSQKRGR